MIALVRFQVAGYVRSLRVLHPLILVLLAVALILVQGPSGPDAADLAVGTLGDVAAFMFPVWAWAARALLDTQPDEQRALTTTAARSPSAPAWAGLFAAYTVNVFLGAVALAVPLLQALGAGSPGRRFWRVSCSTSWWPFRGRSSAPGRAERASPIRASPCSSSSAAPRRCSSSAWDGSPGSPSP